MTDFMALGSGKLVEDVFPSGWRSRCDDGFSGKDRKRHSGKKYFNIVTN